MTETEMEGARGSNLQLAPRRLPLAQRVTARVGERAAGAHRITVIALGVALAAGFLVRFTVATQLSPHIDEPSSLLAAQAVSERGIPVLPSGTVYFHGATLSYLLQPFMWLGVGDLDHLNLMRMVLVLAGVVTIYLCYRLGSCITGQARIGIVMAALVALDPLSVQWSGHLRMYGLLQALTVGLAWAYILLLTWGASTGRIAIVVALFWAAVFTHVGAALLAPAMALAAFIIYRWSLFKRWALMATFALCGLAPVTLLTLNEVLGTASATATTGHSSRSLLTFVGDNLLAPLAGIPIEPREWDWAALTRAGNLFWLVPGLIVAVATLFGGRLLLRASAASSDKVTRNGVITLLVFYWVTIVAVGLFTVSPKERYLLNVHVLGYFFLAILVVQAAPGAIDWQQGMSRWLLRGFAIFTALALVAGVAWRLNHQVVHPDYDVAMDYVTEHHDPGQPVIVALPPVAWLSLDDSDHDDLYFLAGPQNQSRAQGYTRWTKSGDRVDYWVGVSAIVTSDDLKSILQEHPDAWVVVDEERMRASWAYGGAIEQLLLSMTEPVYKGPGGVMVLRPVSTVAGFPIGMDDPGALRAGT